MFRVLAIFCMTHNGMIQNENNKQKSVTKVVTLV